jgi:serine/threonine protein kinase
MAITGVRHIPCGAPVNASERLAIEKVRGKLQAVSKPWILLSNLNHSASTSRLSDEIDIVALGMAGVFVIEVKHWDLAYLKQHPDVVESEAERISDKSKRIAGKLRKQFDVGFVEPRLLLTRCTTALHAGQRIQIRGVAAFGLSECKELVNADRTGVLDSQRIEQAAHILAPSSRIALSGDLRNFAGLINLERQPPSDDPFHRVYRGQHPTRRDKVILHLYDLSAADDRDAENRARREFEVMQRWQKSPHLPNLLDSFQEAEHYPGEIFYFSLVDPAAPTVADRAQDATWDIDGRLRYARESLMALSEFHSPSDGGFPPIVHRRISPRTLRVRHNGQPLFTDFSLARLAEAQTISSSPASFAGEEQFVAPEVLAGGLAAADARSDVYSVCATLATLFKGDDSKSREARDFLEQGCAPRPEDRAPLTDLAAVLERNTGPASTAGIPLPRAEYWDEDTVVQFQNAHYKIVSRLGRGGIGQTFKVVQIDDRSEELYGTYVAKLIHHEADAESALHAYRKARAYTVHPNLSAIHEIAPVWKRDSFVALLKWIEGIPLADLAGVLSLYAEELDEPSVQVLILRWLGNLCAGLWQLHCVGLVHGDVSPRNVIVHGGNVVLTDYDTVTNKNSRPRSRNPLYASFNVEAGTEVVPADDIFSLAASFFYVLFEKEPFLFGAERPKNRGCNWQGIEHDGMDGVIAFIKRATSPNPAERFEDARAAVAFLMGELPRGDNQVEPPLPPALVPQIAPRLAELLSAYPGARQGNSETRGLDSPFAVATYVETRLDQALRTELLEGRVALAILFGNAGDGKTAFLQHLLQELGLQDTHSSHRVLALPLADGRTLKVNLDGSAALNGEAANSLLDDFFQPFQSLDFAKGARQPHVLAINSGKLLEWLETQEDSPLTAQLQQALFGDAEDAANALDSHIRLIDLNHRSLVGGIEQGEVRARFLNVLLDRFIGEGLEADPWAVCSTCTAQHRCTARHSVTTLRDPAKGPWLRQCLADAFQACHLRGEIHITARELRAALAFIFFGVHDCEELHADPEFAPPFFWDRAFDADAPQRQGELLGEMSRFDPALDSNPLVDRYLLKTTPHGPDDIAQVLASARRRTWFEWDAEQYKALHLATDALHLLGGKNLSRFRSAPLMTSAELVVLCRDLCLGIARLEDLPEVAFSRDNGLPLRIQPRTPTESAFWVVKPWERFILTAPLPRTAEGLESLHTHLVLTYRYARGGEERLPIGLELFHLLLALKDGAQLSGAGQEGIFAHLEIFTQRLAQEDARELHGWHPSDEDRVSRVRVEAQGGRQVLVRETQS